MAHPPEDLAAQNEQLRAELDEASRQIERLQTIRSDVLSRLSHEIKTPLTAILGFSEVLLEAELYEMADIKDFALEIHEKARLMHLISEDLISLARMEAGMMTYDLRMTEVGPLLEGVASEFREECRLRGLEVILQLQPSCPLPIDQEKLHQVLCNLLRNAMDATPKGGQISILTEEDLEECRIIIRDTGCGIEADEINQIFEKFTQIEDILHHQEGLGLGLALSERIIEDGHGGRIIAHSDGKGKGAEFVVHLSRDASAPES